MATLEECLDEWIAEEKQLSKIVYVEDNCVVIDVHYDYNIALDRCDSYESILAWVAHLSKKSWVDDKIIYRFIQVAASANGLKFPVVPG